MVRWAHGHRLEDPAGEVRIWCRARGAGDVIPVRRGRRQGQGRRRRFVGEGCLAAEYLSRSANDLRDHSRQHARDRPRQCLVFHGVSGAGDAVESSLAPVRPASRTADARFAGKPEHRGRRSPDGGSQRPRLGLWRIQRHHFAHRHDRLVELHGQRLDGRIPGRRLSAEWRIDPDDHAAIDGHEVGAGRAAGHGLAQYDPRIRLRAERRTKRAGCSPAFSTPGSTSRRRS